MKDKQFGHGVAGLIVTVFFGGILLLVAAKAVHLAFRGHERAARMRKHSYVVMRTFALLEDSIDAADSHRLVISPRVHTGGIILRTDGEMNAVMSAAPDLRPASDSDALTVLELEIKKSLRIEKCLHEKLDAEVTACPRFEESCVVEEGQSFVGMSVDGMVELEVSESSRGGCCRLRLHRTPSMSLPSPEQFGSCTTGVLVPVGRHYSLYVDRNGRLRYLGHRGAVNIENQPVVEGVDRLVLHLDPEFDGKGIRLWGMLSTTSHRREGFSFVNSLGRKGQYNMLLN